MSEEKWNPSPSSEDFSLEDILLEFSTSYGKSPDAPEETPSVPGSTPASPPGSGIPTAEVDSRWKDLLQELTLPDSLQTKPTFQEPPSVSLPELIVVPSADSSPAGSPASTAVAPETAHVTPEGPQEPLAPVKEPQEPSPVLTAAESGPDAAPETAGSLPGHGEAAPDKNKSAVPSQDAPCESGTMASDEKVSPEGAKEGAPLEGENASSDEEASPEGAQESSDEEASPEGAQESSDEETSPEGAQEPSDEETSPEGAQESSDEEASPEGVQESSDEEASPEGAQESSDEEASPEGAQETADEETTAAADRQEPSDHKTQRRRSQPTADVPFQSDRVLVFLSSALNWFRHLGKKPTQQKVRVPRPKERPAPDTPPKELASQYGRGLGKLRTRSICVLLMGILLLYPTLVLSFRVPAPPFFQDFKVILGVSAGLFLLALFWSRKFLWEAFVGATKRQFDMPLITLMAVICTIADGISMFVGFRPQSLPLFAPVTFVLGVQMLGRYWDLLCKRLSCRTAALAAEPYAVTLDYDQWEGEPSFRKHAVMECPGFGSQIQSRDGAQKRFTRLVPVLLIICLALALISTVAHHQPKLVFWGLSAYFSAASALTGCLCFSLPSLAITRRLSGLGAALAGWDGIEDAQDSDTVLLEDGDFFPPGTVKLQTFQTFEEFAPERVISLAATLIRASGSGLDSLFHNLVRAEDGQYLNLSNFAQYPSGMSGTISDQEVFVGNAQFMEEMGVEVPDGFRVRNAVFCSMNLRLAGLFMLEYNLHRSIPLGVDALLTSKLTPVLLGRDFNLIPSMLRQKFKLPWDKMVFATPTQRDGIPPEPSHQVLTAVLCREGMEPYATAVAGAQRLAFATRLNSIFACLGSVVGIILTFFLVSAGAVNALSGVSLSLFLFLWLIPVALLSGWVNQF